MSRQVVVITRKLPGHDLVVSKVVAVPEDIEVIESYAWDCVEAHRESFTTQFVEFRRAEFDYTILPLSSTRW